MLETTAQQYGGQPSFERKKMRILISTVISGMTLVVVGESSWHTANVAKLHTETE